MTDDLTLVLKKAYSLYKAAEAAQRIGSDLDQDKANMKVANESIDRGQKRLRRERSRKGSVRKSNEQSSTIKN